ncbi:hypothetical protein D3C74_49700 [compost metagenome]
MRVVELAPISKCDNCGSEVEMVSSREFYGVDYGNNVYRCTSCDSYVGTHRNSSIPLGTLADAELRSLRRECHQLFDPVWKIGNVKRSRAYKWLALKMKLPKEKAHIGMFNKDQCRRLIDILDEISG